MSPRLLCEQRADGNLTVTPRDITTAQHRVAKAICDMAWEETKRGRDPVEASRDAFDKIRARGIEVVLTDRVAAMLEIRRPKKKEPRRQ